MALADLKEGEAKIAEQTTRYSVALEDTLEYAAEVGIILSLFAVVEGYPHLIMEKVGVMSRTDASATLSVFRAFSNRLDLMKEVGRRREENSRERACLQYYRTLLNEANKIRNKYAHCTYSNARTHYVLRLYSGDHNRGDERVNQKLEDFRADRERLKRIICELHAFCYRDEIPAALQQEFARLGL